MLLIMSLTELFLPTADDVVRCSCCGVSGFESVVAQSLTTEVSSPDLRSTPTMDHGLGFGNGFGFGGHTSDVVADVVNIIVVVVADVVRGFGSGDVPVDSPGENFDALSPTIEPFKSSFPGSSNLVEIEDVGSGFEDDDSDVGEVRFVTSPVDLVKVALKFKRLE